MNVDEIIRRIALEDFIVCARCKLSAIVTWYGRERGQTRVRFQCHGEQLTALIEDATVEDNRHLAFWSAAENATGPAQASRCSRRVSRTAPRSRGSPVDASIRTRART